MSQRFTSLVKSVLLGRQIGGWWVSDKLTYWTVYWRAKNCWYYNNAETTNGRKSNSYFIFWSQEQRHKKVHLDQLNIFQLVSFGLKLSYLAQTPKGAVLENGDVVLRKVVITDLVEHSIDLSNIFIHLFNWVTTLHIGQSVNSLSW